jgi:predicted ATP-grasp superfamily ATP-dependent carboligase
MKKALLLLMHQGNSFVEDIHDALVPMEVSLIALTSRPSSVEIFEKNQNFLADWIVTDDEQLVRKDVELGLEAFRTRGYDVLAGLATFEGYRLLMADVNAELGARDSDRAALQLCLDKFQMRSALQEAGLSEVCAYRLGTDRPPVCDPSKKWFIKPVRGASSFACFIMEDVKDLEDLPRLRSQMQNDEKMAAIFMGNFDFLVEEYVEGPEFSFEIVVVQEVYHVCVHEKAQMQRQSRTTLEVMSVSPPLSIDQEAVSEGAAFITKCFEVAGLTAGAFHVEAKYWQSRRRWEIIEINPRMGGSLINASVATITGASILDLWIRSLILEDEELPVLLESLERCSQVITPETNGKRPASLFISKYGEKGRVIDSIEFSPTDRPPAIYKLHEKPGRTLANSDRALCLLDALWEVDRSRLNDEVIAITELVDQQFKVSYR